MSRRPKLVTVVIPVRGEEPHLAEQLGALAMQSYSDAWEVMIVDNGATAGPLRAARERADLVGGRLELETINSRLTRTWTDWDAPVGLLTGGHDFLPFVPGNNCGVWAVVVRELPWDEAFRYGSSDTEWAWRAQLAGYRLAFAPEALLHYRLRSSLMAIARQHFRYGTSPGALRRVERRGRWVRKGALRAGRLVGSLRARVVFL